MSFVFDRKIIGFWTDRGRDATDGVSTLLLLTLEPKYLFYQHHSDAARDNLFVDIHDLVDSAA